MRIVSGVVVGGTHPLEEPLARGGLPAVPPSVPTSVTETVRIETAPPALSGGLPINGYGIATSPAPPSQPGASLQPHGASPLQGHGARGRTS
jgi:hypothetical protein